MANTPKDQIVAFFGDISLIDLTLFKVRPEPRVTSDRNRMDRWRDDAFEVAWGLYKAVVAKVPQIQAALQTRDDQLGPCDSADDWITITRIFDDASELCRLRFKHSVNCTFSVNCMSDLVQRLNFLIRELWCFDEIRIQAALYPEGPIQEAQVETPVQPPVVTPAPIPVVTQVEIIEISDDPDWIPKVAEVDKKRKRSAIRDPDEEEEQEEEISMAQEWNLWDTESEEFSEGPSESESDLSYAPKLYSPPTDLDTDDEDIEVTPAKRVKKE